MTTAEYLRAIEHHICQKNDGHLIRIVGPAFEVVSGWERDGVPLKVAQRGIDRYFERYYRNGPKRRPVRVEFCDTDVREVFDEWRRAVGAGGGSETRGAASSDRTVGERHGSSLPAHLERVLIKLSSARATGRLGPDVDMLLDRISVELDAARAETRGLRGDARRALLERLVAIDAALVEAVANTLPEQERQRMDEEARDELAAYRDRMAPEAYARAARAIRDRLVREHAGLPVVSYA